MRQFISTGLVLFIFFSSSLDQKALSQIFLPYNLDSIQDEYGDILEFLYIHKDENRSMTADVALDHLFEFEIYRGEKLSKKDIYWFIFKLNNNTNTDQELNLFIGDIDFFDFYEISNNKVNNIIKGGGLRPAWDLTYPDENRYTVPIDIESGLTKMYLIRFENGEFFNHYPVFKLYARDKFENLTNLEIRNFWQGIFHGILWVMIIYNIFFAFIGKDKTYLYYALYMIAISFYFLNIFGYLKKYAYPNHPEFGTYVWLIMQTAAIFYIIFVRKFLDLKHLHKQWFRISKFLLIAVIIFVLFKASYLLIFKDYGILSYLSQIVLLLGVVFTAGLIISLYRTKNQLAKYFTIGSVSLGLGLLVASIFAFIGEAYTKNFFYSIQAGIVFEIFFFSIGLSYKMRETEREKRLAQDELIYQLKENEKLQLTYQRELEQKVEERTQEIVEQKKELENQKSRLEELNEDKNHLISIVAHDLRNPLTSALSMAQLLETDDNQQEKAEIGKVVKNSLKRMNEMIDKILDIRAIESQKIKMEKEFFDLGPETKTIIDQLMDRATAKSIHIHMYLNPAMVHLDKNYFFQVAENLISNSIKFSPKYKNVYVSTWQDNGKAFFEIRDEGPGFTEEDKKRIFGKFQKLSAKPTAGESSTGIGLSVVKKYVLAMDGNISYESAEGEGASFKVEFKGARN